MFFDLYACDLIVAQQGKQYFSTINGTPYQCAVGENGLSADKKEGDDCTPIGTFPLRGLWIRPDKIDPASLSKIQLPIHEINENDGWCDDVNHPKYNQHVILTKDFLESKASHEQLHRGDDYVYDIFIDVGYNDVPGSITPGKGSAIFIHIARPGYTGTAGCIAFSKEDLLKILSLLTVESKLIVKGS